MLSRASGSFRRIGSQYRTLKFLMQPALALHSRNLTAVSGRLFGTTSDDAVPVSYIGDAGDSALSQINRKIVLIEESIGHIDTEILILNRLLRTPEENWSTEEKRFYADYAQVREEKSRLSSQITELRREINLRLVARNQFSQSHELSEYTEFVFKAFDRKSFKLLFPFFLANGDSYLTLLNRDAVLTEIKNIFPDNRSTGLQKYQPIIISTSKGMGKTFLLKMIGSQKIGREELRSKRISDAISLGRIISFDFLRFDCIKSLEDAFLFPTRLMIYYLCLIFDHSEVSGIKFLKINSILEVENFSGTKSFNTWKSRFIRADSQSMIDEYIRLTNIAFDAQCQSPPVFLFDEVQALNEIKVTDEIGNNTLLLRLLKSLACGYDPVCICTGTNSGNILSIAETSSIIPRILSLAPLTDPEYYNKNWDEMTEKENADKLPAFHLSREKDSELVMCLIHASYKIPRLLWIAHGVWSRIRSGGEIKNMEYFVQNFEHQARLYYAEMKGVWKTFSKRDITNLMLSCACNWKVSDDQIFVPGTQLKWQEVTAKSLIFPSGTGSFIFPFSLIWNQMSDKEEEEKFFKNQVAEFAQSLIKNINLNDLFLSFDTVSGADIHTLGIMFEKILTAGIVSKYYVLMQSRGQASSPILLSDIFQLRGGKDALIYLSKATVDLSDGIARPSTQRKITKKLSRSVIHYVNLKTAHHDIIIPTGLGPVPVQVKATFNLNPPADICKQLLVSRNSTESTPALIWVYLGHDEKENQYPNVAFVSAKAVCSDHEIDLLDFAKRLRAANNRLLKIE